VLSVRSLNYPTSTTPSPSYQQPSSVMQGRIIRIGTQVKW
jgi:hypothetical protein